MNISFRSLTKFAVLVLAVSSLSCSSGVEGLFDESSESSSLVAKFGGAGDSEIQGVATDSSGNSYLSGYFFNDSTNTNGFSDFSGTAMAGLTATISSDGFLVKLNSSGEQIWRKTFGGTGADSAYNVCARAGLLFVVGYYTNNSSDSNTAVDFNGAQLNGKTATADHDAFVARINPDTGAQLWIRSLGGTGTEEYGLSCAITSDNKVAVGGYVNNNTTNTRFATDFSGAQLNGVSTTAALDSFVAMVDVDGTQEWIEVMGGTSNDRLYYLGIDSNNNIFVPGYYQSSSADGGAVVDFAGNSVLGKHTANTIDGFVAKLNSSGVQQWFRTIGGSSGNDFVVGAATDTLGNVYVTGSIGNNSANVQNVTDFNGNTLPGVSVASSREIMVAKLDGASGNQQWIRVAGGEGLDRGQAIAVSTENLVYVIGYFNNSAADVNLVKDFNNQSLLGKSQAGNSLDGVLIKMNPSGDQLGVRTLGGEASDSTTAIALDPSRRPLVCGYFNNDNVDTKKVIGFSGSKLLSGGNAITKSGYFERLDF